MKRLLIGLITMSMVLSLCACNKKEVDNTGDNKITWWTVNSISTVAESYDDSAAIQELKKKFGVEIEFIHPSSDSESEQFNVMAASKDFSDIVDYNWNIFGGGAVKAGELGLIVSLDEHLDKMPNFSKRLNESRDIDYLHRGYDGKIYVLPSFTGDIVTEATFGPQIRKDWLDKLGLDIPKTFDDWHEVLTAFKTQDPNGNGEADEIPFMAVNTATFLFMSSGFNGINQDFCVDENGKIVFGFVEPEYKEFLTVMNQWYKDGLINDEYTVLKADDLTNAMVSDKGGSFVGYCGSAMSKYMVGGRADNPDYTLVAAPWPTVEEGGTSYVGYQYQNKIGSIGKGMAFSTANKDLDKTLEMIDYLYSDEGRELFNWGIKDETYTIDAEGKKQYTDLILNNPEGKTPVEAICKYAFVQYPIAFKDAEAYMQVNNQFPEQGEAMNLWAQGDISRIMPSLSLSPEGQEVLTEVMDDIYTYRAEWLHKFVMGKAPISQWDQIAEDIRGMGIDRVCAVYQEAYDKYLAQ